MVDIMSRLTYSCEYLQSKCIYLLTAFTIQRKKCTFIFTAPSSFLFVSQPVTDSQQGQGESGELRGHTDRVSEGVTPTSTPNTSVSHLYNTLPV